MSDQQPAPVDPRHQKRIDLMQLLFSYSFYTPEEAGKQPSADQFEPIAEIIEMIPELDQAIAEAAPERPLTEVNKVDLAILRLSMFESIQTKTPTKVLINEAVELAKEFGSESSSRFVNGVLGKLLAPANKA